jgi:hypothetical protein
MVVTVWYDYLKTEITIDVQGNKLAPSPLIPKVITTQDKIEFSYPGFNFSHSTYLDLLGLRVVVYK